MSGLQPEVSTVLHSSVTESFSSWYFSQETGAPVKWPNRIQLVLITIHWTVEYVLKCAVVLCGTIFIVFEFLIILNHRYQEHLSFLCRPCSRMMGKCSNLCSIFAFVFDIDIWNAMSAWTYGRLVRNCSVFIFSFVLTVACHFISTVQSRINPCVNLEPSLKLSNTFVVPVSHNRVSKV